MPEYKVNEKCIIGMPQCGYGFTSSRMCFIARPSDGEFQLEQDILNQLLLERNYETYVALQRIDPGNFAFCTKICSKIITSHFCIVLLNQSSHAEYNHIKISNPNVYLEYGMMLSFHKHIIPMQRESESLPFNIFPIDTIKYKPDNFKDKAQTAIDDAILRFETKEPPGQPIGSASEVLKYFSFRDLRFSDTGDSLLGAIFKLGEIHGFNLFDGDDKIVFFGYFYQEEPREIIIRVRFLINNIKLEYNRAYGNPDIEIRSSALRLIQQMSIEVLTPENTDIEAMRSQIAEYQKSIRNVEVILRKPSDIEAFLKTEYEKIKI